jgi:CzcA family heavy metal efflux pump
MLKAIVLGSLRLPIVVLAASVLLAIAGYRATGSAALDVFPEFAPPVVEIQTEAPGLSTSEVESLVTVPIESVLTGVSWLATMRSKSVLGLSSVVLIFEEGADLMRARQMVQERLLLVAGRLPAAAHPPVMLSPLSSTSRVLKIGVWSKKLDQVELTTLAKWTVRPRLMAITGVANVAIWGQRDRQIQVLVDPDGLRAQGVTLQDTVLASQKAVAVGAGGFIDTPNQRLAVNHVSTIHSAADMAAVPVAWRDGGATLLGDVAAVVEGFPPPIGDAVINDGPGLLLIVEKQPWGNTLDVTRKVEDALDALRPGLQDLEMDATIFRPATFIEMSLHNLRVALLLGCILVIGVLIAFLYEWRTALISVVAIPLSLLAAVLVLTWRGDTINTMVLAGLAIALGEVVDDAIIDVENIYRRLRLNQAAGNPESNLDVVLNASLEVRSAVLYGTMIVVFVFLPVFMLEGLPGAFFRPLATSYVLAVLGSLLVALTLTPALSLMLLPGVEPRGEPPAVAWLKARYRPLLPRLIDRPRQIVVWLAGIFAVTMVTAMMLGEEFLPNFKEYDFLMHWVEKPGTSLDAMRRITIRVSRELRAIPGVRNFGSHIGRAEVADEVVGPNFTELWISVDPKVDYHETVAKIQEVVDGYPGLYRDVLTYLKERIKEVLTGTSGAIVVRIYGPELATLRAQAAAVGKAMEEVDGVSDLKVEQQVLVPQVEVRLRPEAGRTYGVTPADVRIAAATLIKGQKVGEFVEDQKVFDVVVWGQEGVRDSLDALRALPIDTPMGGQVPMGQLAEVVIAPTPNVIQRESSSRRIDVTCNVRNRDLGAVARDIETRVRALSFPQGYHPEFLGEYATRQESKRRLYALGALSMIAILLLLHVDFASPRLTFLVFLTLPFALVGGVLAAVLTGGVLSLGSLVGFITVLGIAARNGIMLVSHYRHLETREGEPFGRGLVLRGTEERLAPILMTGMATALALLPIIVGGDRPGHEIEHPMAVVIFGGLVTSTLLNLFVLPPLYLRYGAVAPKPAAEATV